LPGIDLRIIAISDAPIPDWRDDLELAVAVTGEIAVRGPQVTAGYFNLPEATLGAKIRHPDGGFFHRMGDLGYLDAEGRVWFCGRKSQRVQAGSATLYTIPCEGVFNTHPDVYRTALIGIPGTDGVEPAICVELEPDRSRRDHAALRRELRELGAAFQHTRTIRRFFIHPGFPVDIRHNAKIDRERLARWAGRQRR